MRNTLDTKPKATLKPYFQASVKADVLEMLVYDQIGESWDGSGVTAKDFKAALDANTFDSVSVRINSPGGDVFEGVAICNLLKSCGKPVDVFIDGVAASSASIVAMAGTTISIANNALIMIHNAWSMAIGEAKDLRKMADTLDTVTASIATTYVDRTGQSLADVKAMMDAETWLNATDAVAKGFATAVVTQSPDGAVNGLAKSFKALTTYRNVPAVLKNDDMEDEAGCNCPCEQCEAGNCAECSNPDCMDDGCIDCPIQTDNANNATTTEVSNLSLYEARLKLLKIR